MIREIRLLLGDQLNPQHTWFEDKREDVLYVMMEIRPELSITFKKSPEYSQP